MITAKQRDIITIARDALALAGDEAAWAKYLREHAGVDCLEDLSSRSYDRLIDRFINEGFRDARHVSVIEPDYMRVLRRWADLFGMDDDEFAAVTRAADAVEPDKLDGEAFRRLVRYFTFRGARIEDLDRGIMTSRQIALLHVAKRELDIQDERFRGIMVEIGGVLSVENLSKRGFDRVLAFMVGSGFEVSKRRPAKRPSYGRRPNMASAAQINLIRELWLEWSGADQEDALNAWLERFHHVSSLRFLTAGAAGSAIRALKAMKHRRASSGSAA